MIKPEEFNNKLEEIKNEYKELYEMFDYLNNSRDEYIDENFKIKENIKKYEKLTLCLLICFIIEFILFLFAII